MSMKCEKCQAENSDGSSFCSQCGHALGIVCSQCSHVASSTSKFCSECGQALSSANAQTTAKPSDSHKDKSTLGERRHATIMFADITGFTRMSERLDPEDVEMVLDRFKDIAHEVIEGHGGAINQFVGDEAVCLFGLPSALDDDPVRAVRAAVALHERTKAEAADFQSRIGQSLSLHIGINTGLIVVQPSQGAEGRFQVTGDAVNLAARLRAEAGVGESLVGPNTYRFIKPYFVTERRTEVQVKGKQFPIAPYRIVAESNIDTRFDAARERGFASYVGRVGELESMQACLERVRQGIGQFITIEGEAGLGKSRLLHEFLDSLDREEVSVPQGRCQTFGTEIPYYPFIDGLRRGLQINDQRSPAAMLDKAIDSIRTIDPDLHQYLPLYLHLLSIPNKLEFPEHLSGEALRRAMEDALAAIITRTAHIQPTVLVLEDWHWSDPASRAMLGRLLPMLPEHQLMVVVTFRAAYGIEFADIDGLDHTSIRLESLSESETQTLIQNAMGVDELPEGMTSVVYRSTEGNPLFVEETCYSLLESESIKIKQRQVRLCEPLEQLLLPDTVQAVIRARLDRLDRDSRQVVGVASVIGRNFLESIIARAWTGGPLKSPLERLQLQEIIRQVRLTPEPEYSFRHVLAREVAYDALLNRQRKKLHGDVAKAIEAVYSDRLQQYASVLAYHYTRSNLSEKAIEYLLIAGDQAARIYANDEALTYYDDALSVTRTLPASPKVDCWQIDSTLKQVSVGTAARDLEADIKNLEQACALAEALDDLPRLANALYWLGRTHYILAQLDVAIEKAEQSLKIARAVKEIELEAPPINLLGRAYWQLSNFAKSAELTEISVEQMRKLGNKEEEATASGFVSALFGYLGEFDKAIAYSDRSLALAQELESPYAEAATLHYRGIIRDQQGDWSEAVNSYKAAEEIAREAGDSFRLYIVKFMEGRARTMLGQSRSAYQAFEESKQIAEQLGTTFLLGQMKTFLVDYHLAFDDFDGIQPLNEQAIALAREAGDKFTTAICLRSLAKERCRSAGSETLSDARHSVIEAVETLRAMQARPELARTLCDAAAVVAAQDDHTSAKTYLNEAASIFEDLAMDWDKACLEKARTKLED